MQSDAGVDVAVSQNWSAAKAEESALDAQASALVKIVARGVFVGMWYFTGSLLLIGAVCGAIAAVAGMYR